MNQITVKRFGAKRQDLSEIAKGEADHAPSPLPQGMDKLVNQITVKPFGAKRQDYQMLTAVRNSCTDTGDLLSFAVMVQLRPLALAL